MSDYSITPAVYAAQEYIEIANDFANPLDLVREAISNAFDADATSEYGNRVLLIVLKDNAKGMDRDTLKCFFDLGTSSKRGKASQIGEKGHGIKVFFMDPNCAPRASTG